MKLWLISQNVNNGYDTHDSAVVAADNVDEARATYPSGNNDHWDRSWTTWAESPDQVNVEFLGEAKEGTKAGVILASFNAG